MKTFYFLKSEMPNLNCGIIESTNEILREVFDYTGLPQTIYIANGIPYYL